MENLKLTHVTLMEEVETTEARKIYDKYQQKYKPLIAVPFLIFIIVSCILLLSIALHSMALMFAFSIIVPLTLITVIFCCAIYSSRMEPYTKLLKIAKRNDEIRHEERIREKERQRLANPANRNKQYTINDIDTTMPDTDNKN